MISADQALERLREGNRRFVAGDLDREILASAARRDAVAGDQKPFAIVLGCSDSQVPAEIVFDCGLGDLFVTRVAGNVVAPSQIGSIEYAAERFGTRLVVVLGHSHCGAVAATLEASADDLEAAMPAAVEANILASVEQLLHGSELLESLVSSGGLRIIGAQYSLETGKVTFYL